MNKYSSSLSFTAVLCFFLSAYNPFQLQGQTDPKHPNVLLVISDDLGIDVSNGYANSPLMPNTPILDSLRTSGLTFMNAWATPVCTPTRATMMSGKYGVKTQVTGVPGNLDVSHTSLFTQLATESDELYVGAVIGKWHISSPADLQHPAQHGVDYYNGVFDFGVDDYYTWDRVENGTKSVENTYSTSYFTDAAIDWVNEQESPWFLWLAEVAPHSPYHEPPADLYTTPAVRSNKQKYVAAIEAMDMEIGRLLHNIPDSVLQNTLIIYLGDNGTPGNVIQNTTSNHGKGTLYQGGIHVPFFVSGPMVSRVNETEDALVQATDIHATILEATGSELAGGLYNSLSFLPLLSNTQMDSRTYSYTELSSNSITGWTIRNDNYKLISLDNDTDQEFYDLVNDPNEVTNLIGSLSDELSSIKAELEQEAMAIRSGWSCNDFIQNGDEEGIDCGGTSCEPCTTIGIQTRDVPEVMIAPNPNDGSFLVQMDNQTIESISIYSLLGELVYTKEGIDRESTHIVLPSLSPQILVAEVLVDGRRIHSRIKVM